MTVDESVENLKITVEAFERLRVGLRPFVEETITRQFPNLTPADLWRQCNPGRPTDSNNSLPESPDTFAGMDIADILTLMGNQENGNLLAFKRAFGGRVGDKLIWSHKVLKDYRNQAAHHNGLPAQQLTLNQVREVLATAATWLEAIADRYPAAKEQLAKLEVLQAELGRPPADPLTPVQVIPETMADYVLRNPDLRAAIRETIQRHVGLGNVDVMPTSQQGDPDGAVAQPLTVQEVLGESPMTADIHDYFNRGNKYFSLGQYEQAIAAFTQVIALAPDGDGAYINRGNSYANLGQHEQAIADFTQAIALDPQDASAYYNRGISYAALGQHEQAIADFTQAAALAPQYPDPYYNRANSYADLGQHQQAVADFTKAIALDLQNAAAYTNRGNSYYSLGQYEQALSDYDQALALDPQHTEAYFRRGLSCFFLERYEQAIADFGKTIAGNTQEAAAYNMRGLSYVNLEQYELAIEDYTQAIALDPKDAVTYFYRGLCYADLRKFDQALADFSQAIELNPQYASAYHVRGICYTELRQYREAVADFTAAINISPTAQLHQSRGEAYESWGNEAPLDDQSQLFDQALADYEEADRLRDFE